MEKATFLEGLEAIYIGGQQTLLESSECRWGAQELAGESDGCSFLCLILGFSVIFYGFLRFSISNSLKVVLWFSTVSIFFPKLSRTLLRFFVFCCAVLPGFFE